MREYLLVFVVAAVMTYAATPFVRWLAFRTGAITAVRDRDIHTIPIPRLGGVAMLFGFIGALVVASRLPYLSQIFQGGEMMGVLIGAVLVCAVGVLDDIRELDWLTKLAGQMLAAGVMAFQGVQLLSLPLFGVTVLPAALLLTLTILTVIVSSNAVNFIDGLDGLAAGVVAIAGLAFFSYSYLLSRTYDPPNVFSSATFITAALVGCCVGFLPHNFHPARLFMGDSGSLMLGLLLAAATISMTGNIDPSVPVGGNAAVAILLPVVLPLAIMSLPLLDVLLAVVRRTRAGRRPWHPDAEHLHHRMLRIGHTHMQAVLLLYLWAAVVALGVVSFAFVDGWLPLVVIMVVALSAAVLTLWLPRWMPTRRPEVHKP
ncbi:MAG: UDP-GlcNAc:undecaprenyl-phosphate/decaprenyl-phosphate GlcNAc-phosphate transferase [Actinomycetota bacterium]|nr:UDP-GlcNAc:undecaprenyl-phosphate/decaprenyl-phosphate GlcNAc-phosphate transferase [Actinomycetota bacterium]